MEIFQTSEFSKAITFVRKRLWVVFHEANGNKTNKICCILSFRASWLSKVSIFSKHIFDESLNLQVFQSSRTFKIPYSFKRCLPLIFHHTGGLQNKQSLPLRNFFIFEKKKNYFGSFPQARTSEYQQNLPFRFKKIIGVCFCNSQA